MLLAYNILLPYIMLTDTLTSSPTINTMSPDTLNLSPVNQSTKIKIKVVQTLATT